MDYRLFFVTLHPDETLLLFFSAIGGSMQQA